MSVINGGLRQAGLGANPARARLHSVRNRTTFGVKIKAERVLMCLAEVRYTKLIKRDYAHAASAQAKEIKLHD